MSQDDCLCLQTFIAVICGGYAGVGGGNADGCCESCGGGGGGGDGSDGGGVFGRGRAGSIGCNWGIAWDECMNWNFVIDSW